LSAIADIFNNSNRVNKLIGCTSRHPPPFAAVVLERGIAIFVQSAIPDFKQRRGSVPACLQSALCRFRVIVPFAAVNRSKGYPLPLYIGGGESIPPNFAAFLGFLAFVFLRFLAGIIIVGAIDTLLVYRFKLPAASRTYTAIYKRGLFLARRFIASGFLRIFYGWGGSFGSSEAEGWDCPSIAEVSACIPRSYNRPKKLDSKLLRAGWLPSIV
jgi:hypothetical protein